MSVTWATTLPLWPSNALSGAPWSLCLFRPIYSCALSDPAKSAPASARLMHSISHIRSISSAMRRLSNGSAARQGPASATRSRHWETGGLELLCIAFPFVAAASRSLLVPFSASPPAASHSWRVMFCQLEGQPNSAAFRWPHFDVRFEDL